MKRQQHGVLLVDSCSSRRMSDPIDREAVYSRHERQWPKNFIKISLQKMLSAGYPGAGGLPSPDISLFNFNCKSKGRSKSLAQVRLSDRQSFLIVTIRSRVLGSSLTDRCSMCMLEGLSMWWFISQNQRYGRFHLMSQSKR